MKSIEFAKKVPLELLCMLLLEERDMYGYEMVQELKKRTDGLLTINVTTLYLALKRLTERQYISTYYSEEAEAARERSRIYYHWEPAAEEYQEQLFGEYQKAVQGVQKFLDYSKTGKSGAA